MKRNDVRVVWLSICAALLLYAAQTRAECSGTVSASVSGNVINVTASGGGACGTRSSIVVYLDGSGTGLGKACETTPTCVLTGTLDASCKRSGTHQISATFECGNYNGGTNDCRADTPHTAISAFAIDDPPTVSVTRSGRDSEGTVSGTVTYHVPRTPYQSGGYETWLETPTGIMHGGPSPINGGDATLPWSVNTKCWKPGSYKFTVRVTACGGETAEDSVDLDVPDATPALDLTATSLGFDGSTAELEGVVTYDMKDGTDAWSVTVDVLEWIDAHHVTHPGYRLAAIPTPTRSGTEIFHFSAPTGAQQIRLLARASNCVGSVVKNASVDCPSCQMPGGDHPGVSSEPVYFNDGNMRATDVDPLPEIGGLRLVRTYNSQEQESALFGRGWTTELDQRIMIDDLAEGRFVSIVTGTNEVVTFQSSAAGFVQVWPSARPVLGSLSYDANAGVFTYRPAGALRAAVFRASDGRIIAERDLSSTREVTIAYDGSGVLQSVSDSWTSTSWQFTIDAASQRVSSITVPGEELTWTYAYDADGNLSSVTGPDAALWRIYEYVNDRMTASRDALGHLIESHTYDTRGRAISSIGRIDEIAGIEYDIANGDPDERVTRVTQSNGSVADYTFRRAGGAYRAVRVINGCGSCGARDATIVYDERGRVLRKQGADGYVTTWTYAGDRLDTETRFMQPSGCDPQASPDHCRRDSDALAGALLAPTAATATTRYVYGDPNWPDRVTQTFTPSVAVPGQERSDTLTYRPSHGTVTQIDTRGWVAGPPAAAVDRITSIAFYGDGQNSTAPAFDPGGAFNSAWLSLPQPPLRKSVDGPRADKADVTMFVYYPIDPTVPAHLRGRLAAAKNAAGHVSRYEFYDVFGNAARMTDPNGVSMESTFDVFGRLLTSTVKGVAGCDTARDPLCATDLTTVRSYAATAGPLRSELRPAGGVTVYDYDSRGRVMTVSRGPAQNDLREQIETAYDPGTGRKSVERMLAFESGSWVEKSRQSYAYDSLGQLQTLTHADGTSIGYTYDPEGALAAARDENHTQANTSYSYDSAHRLAAVVQMLGATPVTTTYAYDVHGNLRAVTDPNGNVTTYAHDDFGQLVSQQSPVSGATSYTYDPAGNLVSSKDANNVTTARTYDALGRLLSAVSTRGTSQSTVTWTYDEGVPFGAGRLTSMRDPAGLTQYEYERRGFLAAEAKTIGQGVYRAAYQYDRDGNRSSMKSPSGRVVAYTFDFAGRPFSATADSTPLVTATEYLPFGPATATTLGNGLVARRTYDSRYRVSVNELVNGSEPLASYTYGYDNAGNVTAIQDRVDQGFGRTFGYDDLNRLTSADTGEALWGTGAYAYDLMGNMTTSALGETRVSTFQYVGTTPKLQSITENGNPRVVSYDAAGNEAAVGTQRYSYNLRNLLSTHESYVENYDGRGLRTVTSMPMSIAALSVTPDSIVGGGSVQGTITLSSPAPAGGVNVALTSSDSAAVPPSMVSVAAGQVSAPFTMQTSVVAGETHAVLSAAFNGTSRSVTLTITGSRIDEVQVQPSSIVGGNEAMATVTLVLAAPEHGLVIAVASSSDSVRVPQAVRVDGGAREIVFPVHTEPVLADTDVTLAVTVFGEQTPTTVSLTVVAPALASLKVQPARLRGGSSATGAVLLDGPAPEGGIAVALHSDSALLSLPPAVRVQGGATTGEFTASAMPVEIESPVTISAWLGDREQTATVHIEPPALADLSIAATVVGGDSTAALVAIDAPAANDGASVGITSSDPAVASPGRVVIEAGQTTAATLLPTAPVASATPVIVSATRNGIRRSATVTVTPPPATVAALAVDQQSVIGTNDVMATIVLTDAAPANGVEIELTSSDASIASAPPAVVVRAGARQATFTVVTHLVGTAATITLSATDGAMTKAVALTVLPPSGNHVGAIRVDPAFIASGMPVTVKVTLASPSEDVEVALTSSVPAALALPASVRIHRHATAATLTVIAGTVGGPVPITITAACGGVIRRATVIVAPENAVVVSALTITPPRVIGGGIATATISLNRPAPNGGALVMVEAKRRNIVHVPPSVTVAEGAVAASFPIATGRLAGQKEHEVEIVASYNGINVVGALTVAPAVVASGGAHEPVARCASALLDPCLTSAALQAATNSTPIGELRYTFYTPELSLMAESITSTKNSPPIAYDYVWFGGRPLAQIANATGEISWYFNDHLGTPLVQTDAAARIVWQAEYEPYGNVYAIRTGENHHQPLRLPGQVAEDGSDLYQNVFRWYRAGWGRYTQGDPIGLSAGINLYRYAFSNPNTYTDRTGLFVDPSKALEDLAKQLLESCKTLTGGPKPLPIFAMGAAIFLYATPASGADEPAAEALLKVPYPKCAKKCQENNCPPCNPPVGTFGYNYHKVPPHDPHPGIDGDHVHYFQMQQIPHNCDCFWKNLHLAFAPPPVTWAVPLPTSDPWP